MFTPDGSNPSAHNALQGVLASMDAGKKPDPDLGFYHATRRTRRVRSVECSSYFEIQTN
jgi:hypothetical protein